MSQYTPEGIGALIYRNGKWGPGGDKASIIAFLDTAIAIALAESGGNDQAMNKNSDGSTDYGLWQINSVHKSYLDKGAWNNAGDNTEMARLVWRDAGNSFSPWRTYTTGAYKKYAGHGADVYAKLANMKDSSSLAGLLNPATYTQGLGDTVSQAGKDASSVGNLSKNILDSVFTFIKQSAITVGAAILGIVLLVLGLHTLLRNNPTYKKTVGGAVDIAKVAAVA